MRILQVNSAQTLGGGETHVIELTRKLRELDHSVLVAGRRNGPLNPDIVLPLRNSVDLISIWRLCAILRAERIDVLHAHNARDYHVAAAAALALNNITVIFTRHLLYPVKRHPLYRRVDGWLAPTAEILRTVERLKPRRAAVIPNWVDLNKFKFRPHEPQSPVLLGVLGQIAPHKGHGDAIEALRRLGNGFRLLIGGTGPPDYIGKLKQQAAGLPIEFAGFVSSEDFLQSVDVLLVPSWHEPFGIVLLEAMASGVPVISTACGGPTEIIRSGDHGLLVPPRKPDELAQAVRQIAGSTAFRNPLVQQAHARVESEYNKDIIVPKIAAFYRSTKHSG